MTADSNSMPTRGTTEFWLKSWENGRTGWHEADYNPWLLKIPKNKIQGRVLVPLCGATQDLLWFAQQETVTEVVGVDLSEVAFEKFLEANGFSTAGGASAEKVKICKIKEQPKITFVVGDFFADGWNVNDDGAKKFSGISATIHARSQIKAKKFDLIWDRACIVALMPEDRERYSNLLLNMVGDAGEYYLLTLEYDKQLMDGPPWSIMIEDLERCGGDAWKYERIAEAKVEGKGSLPPRIDGKTIEVLYCANAKKS